MVTYWKGFFFGGGEGGRGGMHCFIISICDVQSRFNDGTNESYDLFIHHKELEKLKNTCV